MKVLMTGGGTGGHLYPALAVAEALKGLQKEVEIRFVGSNAGIESREVPEAGYPFVGFDTRGFPRRPGPRTIIALWSFLRAILKARALLREFQPHVVFSTGGYTSAPVAVAARLEHVPLVLHEQNSVPGLTNRVASRLAAEVHLAFASARRFFPRRGHLRLSGNPLREQVLAGSRTRGLRLFRLEEDRRTVLVFGGSQGAHSINAAIIAALPAFEGRTDIQFLIQSGDKDYEQLLARCREVQVRTWVRRFIANMGDAYALSDLVVCRAGAMTIAELAACGLPSVLIPYPYAAGNHQWLNAEQLRDAGGAVLIADAELTGERLAQEIEALLKAPRRLREMSVNALRMARPDASAKIARALLRFRPAAEIPPEPEYGRRPEYRGRMQPPRRVGPSRFAARGNPGGGRGPGQGGRPGEGARSGGNGGGRAGSGGAPEGGARSQGSRGRRGGQRNGPGGGSGRPPGGGPRDGGVVRGSAESGVPQSVEGMIRPQGGTGASR